MKLSNVVDEATAYKTLERNFISKMNTISLSNTNREQFIRRMETDDLKQLEAEARLKSSEANNEQKMNIILATLPFVNDASKISFKARAKAGGANINSLIDEVKKENETKRATFVSNQKMKFMGMVVNVKLSNDDKSNRESRKKTLS